MQTIKDIWSEFEAKSIPPFASNEQRVAMRLAFYSGCMRVMQLIGSVPETLSSDEVDKYMQSLHDEIIQYPKDVLIEILKTC